MALRMGGRRMRLRLNGQKMRLSKMYKWYSGGYLFGKPDAYLGVEGGEKDNPIIEDNCGNNGESRWSVSWIAEVDNETTYLVPTWVSDDPPVYDAATKSWTLPNAVEKTIGVGSTELQGKYWSHMLNSYYRYIFYGCYGWKEAAPDPYYPEIMQDPQIYPEKRYYVTYQKGDLFGNIVGSLNNASENPYVLPKDGTVIHELWVRRDNLD